MTTIYADLGYIVPDQVGCPSWCDISHDDDLTHARLADKGEGAFMHERHVGDRAMRVVIQQWEYLPTIGRAGVPAAPGYRELAHIDLELAVEDASVEEVRGVASALTEAAALLEAHEGASGDLERNAFELGRDAQAEGLPATNGRPR